ncbi:hypothetical protein PQ455_18785 [Sphingomonas naphthae]|uniref:SGNH hydrolase-type esterase domain-containing protein n=1 Tax=Sphingomonas naphthae TaxID=1813468 RepID=A0ABY7TK72_9SPHN|nr:hypothetical protein [Sphingomonas naphthae]WCT73627.1 hypothetical protein PQ455_18785 [Sphingomonas naphthae]
MPGVMLPAASPEALAAQGRGERLRRAAASATDPFASPPLTEPPAYAASTAYIPGNVVAAGGRWYVAASGGTSPASPVVPSHANGSAVSDGAVLWTYFGPAVTIPADPLAPQVSVSTTAPTLANAFAPASFQTGHVPGAIRAIGGYAYNLGGYAGLYGFDRAAGQPTGLHAGWEFETDEPQVAIGIFRRTAPVQLVIDGRRYAAGGLTMPGTGDNWLTVSFPAGERRGHRIRIELAADMGLRDVRVSAQGQVWAPGRDMVRAAFLSDSIMAGSSFGPFVAGGSAPQRIAAALGWADPWNVSIGGTGYVNGGAGFYTYGQRVAEALTRNPDIWVLMGSTNDNGQPAGTITAAALATLRAIRAGSTAPIVVLGVWSNGAAAAVTEAAVQSAVLAANDPLTMFVPIAGDASLPWVTGSWNNAGHGASANAGLVIGGDGIHPTDGGTAYLARRVVNAIRRRVLPVL